MLSNNYASTYAVSVYDKTLTLPGKNLKYCEKHRCFLQERTILLHCLFV